MEKTITDDQRKAYWGHCRSLMFTSLFLWFVFSFLVHGFVISLNKIAIPLLKFPLGYYMAAQGSLVVFVILIFWFAAKQNAIDEQFGFTEEEE